MKVDSVGSCASVDSLLAVIVDLSDLQMSCCNSVCKKKIVGISYTCMLPYIYSCATDIHPPCKLRNSGQHSLSPRKRTQRNKHHTSSPDTTTEYMHGINSAMDVQSGNITVFISGDYNTVYYHKTL